MRHHLFAVSRSLGLRPMLLAQRREFFDGRWLSEPMLDGCRALAIVPDGRALILKGWPRTVGSVTG